MNLKHMITYESYLRDCAQQPKFISAPGDIHAKDYYIYDSIRHFAFRFSCLGRKYRAS